MRYGENDTILSLLKFKHHIIGYRAAVQIEIRLTSEQTIFKNQ